MILIMGTVEVGEANRAAFIAAATRHVTLSREEAGCNSHGYFEGVMAPGRSPSSSAGATWRRCRRLFAKNYSREIVRAAASFNHPAMRASA